MFSTKSGGRLLTILSKCANLDSDILSSLRVFAQVIRPGPLLMEGLDFEALIDGILNNSFCPLRFLRKRVAKTDQLFPAPTGINFHNHMHYMMEL